MPSRYTLSHADLMRWPILRPADEVSEIDPMALDRPVCVVGARVRVHLELHSKYVSKAHALIVQDAGGVYIRDLASLNHTFVNNQPIDETPLENGDAVRCGPYTFTCQSGFARPSPAAAIAPAELRLQPDGIASRQLITLNKTTFVIGCRKGCDLLLSGDEISLAHAVIFTRKGRRYLRDLSSISGTFVNEQVIREVELNEGDAIRIGQSRIEFSLVPCAIDDEHVIPVQEMDDLQVTEEPEAAPEIAVMQADDAEEAPLSAKDADVQIPLPWEPEELHVKLDADEVLAHQRQTTQRA